MLNIPEALQKKYNRLLIQKEISADNHSDYKKWLRFYLDFCKKYQHPYADSKSLSLFLTKLEGKKQTDYQQTQAKQAVLLYYSGIGHKTVTTDPVGERVESFKAKGVQSPWKMALKSLADEIKLRHYSPKTLKSYSLWAEKIRFFVGQKPPEQLSPDDVKKFLTDLAVEKKVSASSQNQAFNALLFFFRHVLKREFGKIDGVVRAKRKPYIPVVLSREEVDRIIHCLHDPYDLVVKLLYGCGLRLSECMKLRIHNFNFDYNLVTVHDGKGKKTELFPFPEPLPLT